MKKKTINKKLSKLPKVTKLNKKKGQEGLKNFPVNHLSYSSMVALGSNPFMFKMDYLFPEINLPKPQNVSGMIGKAVHKGLETYQGGNDEKPVTDEADAYATGLAVALDYFKEWEGLVEYNTQVKDRESALAKTAFCFDSYVNWYRKYRIGHEEVVATEDMIKEFIEVEWQGKKIVLPVPLKCFVDKVYREEIEGEKRLCASDYKTTASFTKEEAIDGRKLIQAVVNFFCIYAKYGEAPYKFVFEEIKHSANKDKSSQVKPYEIIFEDNPLIFDFFFRYYSDVIGYIGGDKTIYVPNLDTYFDKEISIIAYIHRLDDPVEVAKIKKENGVKDLDELFTKNQILRTNELMMKQMSKEYEKLEAQLKNYKPIDYSKLSMEKKIQLKMNMFGIPLYFQKKVEGKAVDLYLYTPDTGIPMSKILKHQKDIEQGTSVSGIRILAPVPDTEYVGFEVPRDERSFVELPEVKENEFKLMIGEDILGDTKTYDFRKAPHILIGGASGSGKSVFAHSILNQLIKNKKVELHLFDPKQVELSLFEDEDNVKELQTEMIEYDTDLEEYRGGMHGSLESLIRTMESRYSSFKEKKVRDIEGYNKAGGRMKYKVLFIEEYADIVASNKIVEETKIIGYYKDGITPKTKVEKRNISKEMGDMILRLAQKARGAGIHLIISTQRPSVDIISGTIKANFPVKAAFRTAKATDSRVLLDEDGAEKLLGMGDMLFADEKGITRLQGYNI